MLFAQLQIKSDFWLRLLNLIAYTILFVCCATAQAEERIALVIGNADYLHAEKLANPVNDALDVAKALRALGFDVTVAKNLSDAELQSAINAYTHKLRNTEGISLFYYAGHAVQLHGNNYLAPINFSFGDAGDISKAGYDIRILLDRLNASRNKANIVILDSCRNNPFSQVDESQLNRSIKDSDRGLVRISNNNQIVPDAGLGSMDAPINTLIAYSTKPGYVAMDGSGRNSPYTEALIESLSVEGLPVAQVFADVRKKVYQKTGGKQLPWESSSLTDSFQFKTRKRVNITPF